jgi:hypothetical protein
MYKFILALWALLFGAAGCSFTLSSYGGRGDGPAPLVASRGFGKPARQVGDSADDRVGKPARVKRDSPPPRVGREDKPTRPAKPKKPAIEWAGEVPPAKPKKPAIEWAGEVPPAKPKEPAIEWAGEVPPARPKEPPLRWTKAKPSRSKTPAKVKATALRFGGSSARQ